MNESTKKYNKEFAKIKKGIFDRDKWKCLFENEHQCSGQLDVHHIEPRSLGGGNEKENLITVCREFHGSMHDNMTLENRRRKCKERLKDLYDY